MKEMKILGLDYDIIYKDEYSKDEGLMGRSDTKNSSITLIGKMKEDTKQSTILHEVIHIIADKTGLDLKENQVLCLESGLFDFIKENKKFINDIIKD